VENEPKRFIVRIVECAVLLTLSVFLIKLAVCWLMEIWWVLLIIAALAIGGVIGWRIWKNKRGY
jgi:uncharacterized membrane protein YqgA involved in biofilm formation